MKRVRRAMDYSNDRIRVIDCNRAIFVQGDLDDALFSSLTPKIIGNLGPGSGALSIPDLWRGDDRHFQRNRGDQYRQ